MSYKNYSKKRKPNPRVSRLIYVNKLGKMIIKKDNGKKYQRKFQYYIDTGVFNK